METPQMLANRKKNEELAAAMAPTAQQFADANANPGTIGNTKTVGIANAATPGLSMSGQSPTLGLDVPPTVAPVSDAIKYGGNQVIGPNGEPNIGENGYGQDVYNLGGVANAGNTTETFKKINEDQVNSTTDTQDTPPLAPGYSVPGDSTATGTPTVTDAPKDPLTKYLDFLTGSFEDSKKAAKSFNAADQQNELMKTAGVEAVQSNINNLDAQEQQIMANRQARIDLQLAQGNIPLDVAAGRIGEIEKQENTRLAEIGRQKRIALNELQSKNDVIKTIMDSRKYDYEQAKDDYKTQFTEAVTMMNMFRSLKSDAREEDTAKASAINAAEKIKQDALDKQRDDARANITILYNNITDGGFNPQKMTQQEQVNWAQQEMQAGLPAGTFYNLASTSPNQVVKSQNSYTDAKGNNMTDIVMQDRATGALTIKTISGGNDAKASLDLKKLQNEVSNLPLDTLIKKYNITKAEQDIAKNKADIANIPYETQLKKLAVTKAQQMVTEGALDITKKSSDLYENVASDYIDPSKSKYGMQITTSGEVKLSLPKNAEGQLKTLPGREQCGEYVNDALGLSGGNKMPNSYAGKLALAPLDTPQVGGAFVQRTKGKTAENGHTGIVTKVYNDGSWDYSNANEDGSGNGNITTGHMTMAQAKAKGVEGYTPGYNKDVKPNAGKEPTEGEKKASMISEMQSAIESSTNPSPDWSQGLITKTTGTSFPALSGGKMTQESYQKFKEMWKKEGGTASEFDSNFKEYLPQGLL